MKSLFEELGGTYHREGDYLIPDLVLPDEDERPIGVWRQRHERWLKQEHRGLYHSLMFTWKLHEHLVEVDDRAERLFNYNSYNRCPAHPPGWVGRLYYWKNFCIREKFCDNAKLCWKILYSLLYSQQGEKAREGSREMKGAQWMDIRSVGKRS